MTSNGDEYKKLSHREHILTRPHMYIGAVETNDEHLWVYDSKTEKMVFRKLHLNPGLLKIVDEILVNAYDQHVRSITEKGRIAVKTISIECSYSEEEKATVISVANDGDPIPCVQHSTEKMYVPELIFGNLLTSSNYDSTKDRITGGLNGLGCKLTNVFSKRFSIDIKDNVNSVHYKQSWSKNMSEVSKPSVRKMAAQKGHVCVEFVPDLSKFPHTAKPDGQISDDMYDFIYTRAIEIAALVGKECKVSWNGHTLSTNTFEKFVKLFIRNGDICYERCGERWHIAAVLTKNIFSEDETHNQEHKHISFVNAVNTRRGGQHLTYVSKHILGEICEIAAKKRKLDIKPGQLKDSIVFFVNSTIVNPSFDSQSKDLLTTLPSKFGSTPFTGGAGAKLTEGLIKAGVLDEAQAIADAKAAKDAKKTDGSKKRTIRGLPKLEDALWAGTAKSSECTLILTEGDSAATSAIAGLKVVGREAWGIFPLRGKLLNVRDVSTKKAADNKELTEIKKILGLEHGRKYKDVKDLRYGRVMIMSDQDVDGFHIRGLLMNLFHTEWPSLMRLASGFICCLITPLLKTTKGSKTLAFYSESEYDAWKQTAEGSQTGWKTKYYKGLGTSTAAEAREWFQQLNDIKYIYDEQTDSSMELAFSKSKADERKQWLSKYNQKLFLDPKGRQVSYTDFVNKELIHFSNADNIRSIPNVMDGLKPSQRKIIWSALKRNLRTEIRVAQLAGYVSEHAAYHHGETSLTGAITAMAQTFVGSNNINLLVPVGQFGSRLLGGKDAASARYIQTYLEPIVDTIYKKEDSAILAYTDDDGVKVEPETYLPVLPMLLVNGSLGIGTGFSTDVPPFHPLQVVNQLRTRLRGEVETLAEVKLDPWWFGFKGRTMRQATAGVWSTHAIYVWDDAKQTVTVTELPVGTWSKEYKEFLDGLLDPSDKPGSTGGGGSGGGSGGASAASEAPLRSFDDLYNDVDVKFVLYFDQNQYYGWKADIPGFEKKFQLVNTHRSTNMVAFDSKGSLRKFANVGEILENYYGARLGAYERRRQHQIGVLEAQHIETDARMRFIVAVLDERIVLARASDESIVSAIRKEKLPPISEPSEPASIKAYEYLLRMRLDRLKATAVADLEKEMIALEERIASLRAMKPDTMWLADLDEFEAAWTAYANARHIVMTVSNEDGSASGTAAGSGVPKKRKAVVKK
jgi:DNA topoisomerase-2